MMLLEKKGQATLEMAIFGGIILLLCSALLSYTQRLNDQQYVQMAAFRRTLHKARNYGEEKEGCAAQLSLLQNRHHYDILSTGYKKGSTQMVSGSSSVYWAVPEVDGGKTYSLIAYRINEDEKDITITYDYGDTQEQGDEDIIIDVGDQVYTFPYDPDDEDFDMTEEIFRLEDMEFGQQTNFSERITRGETPTAITSSRRSRLQETVTTKIPYSVGPEESVTKDDWQTFWEPKQGVYRDRDGQYKYSESKEDNVVERERTWRTLF